MTLKYEEGKNNLKRDVGFPIITLVATILFLCTLSQSKSIEDTRSARFNDTFSLG